MICVRPCHIVVTWLRCKNMIRRHLLHDTSNDMYDCSGQMNCSFTEKLQRFLHINTNYHNAFICSIIEHHTVWKYVLYPCIFHKTLCKLKHFLAFERLVISFTLSVISCLCENQRAWTIDCQLCVFTLQDDNEGPVTKSIRLTAALILRNLVIYSTHGRR